MGRNCNGTFKIEEALDLQDVVEYKDGALYWKIKPHIRYEIGSEAGTICKNGYKYFSYKSKRYLVHRVVWYLHYGVFPKTIDHIDQNKLNNKIENLRITDSIRNGQNRGKNSNNTSGYKGVCFDKSKNKWIAQIQINSKHKYLGSFETPEQASIKYKEFESKFFNVYGACLKLTDGKGFYSLEEIEQELSK